MNKLINFHFLINEPIHLNILYLWEDYANRKNIDRHLNLRILKTNFFQIADTDSIIIIDLLLDFLSYILNYTIFNKYFI
jgi:hypothetical protein